MTINDVIMEVSALKASQYSADQIMTWLYRLDSKIFHEIVDGHYNYDDEGAVIDDVAAPAAYDDIADVLLVADPYSELYIPYVFAMIDFNNGEFARYNNSMVMFNSKLQEYAAYYTRTHLPKQRNYINAFGKGNLSPLDL